MLKCYSKRCTRTPVIEPLSKFVLATIVSTTVETNLVRADETSIAAYLVS